MKEPQTEEEINEAISDYTNLLNTNGWKRIVAQQDANIELLQKQLEEGVEDEDLDFIKRIRDKIKLHKELRDTPQIMIERLQSDDAEVKNPDPFDTIDDVKKRKLDNEEEE